MLLPGLITEIWHKLQEINLVSPNPVSMMNGHHRNDDVVVVPLEDEPTPIKVNGTVLNGVEQSDGEI